ncbi:MAG: hypothetical protein ABSG21_17240 [Spirochaetia bacterium]
MRKRVSASAILFSTFIFIQVLSAQARSGITPVAELTPLPLSQQLSTMREPIPVETIVDAALGFSGASDSAAATAKDRLSSLLLKFRGEVAEVSDQAALAERALLFLHRNLFTSYSALQTRVDTALDTGVYNCVSSAVLYMVLARSVGLSVGGVRTPDHAFASVLVNGQQLDVETTNPYGFNPGAKKEFTDSFGKITGYSYVPPGSYVDRRAIGEKELLSLILYNRVSEYMDGRSFRDALQPAVSAFVLMGTDETRQVMTTAFTLYITWLGTRQEFPQAVQFTDGVKAAFGGIVNIDQPLDQGRAGRGGLDRPFYCRRAATGAGGGKQWREHCGGRGRGRSNEEDRPAAGASPDLRDVRPQRFRGALQCAEGGGRKGRRGPRARRLSRQPHAAAGS